MCGGYKRPQLCIEVGCAAMWELAGSPLSVRTGCVCVPARVCLDVHVCDVCDACEVHVSRCICVHVSVRACVYMHMCV